MLSRSVSPIWMDSSTSVECREITAAVGGPEALAAHTGSRAFERFTGPQIRKFFKQERPSYLATGRIHLVSSFLASLLVGQHAPLDPGDASGMNLMDVVHAIVVGARAGGDGARSGVKAAADRALVDDRGTARAVLAVALRAACGTSRRLVRRQSRAARSAPASFARAQSPSRSARATPSSA